MRKLLNTVFVTSPDSYLSRDGENIVVRLGDKEGFRIPSHNIEGIVCFGWAGASPALIGLCSERNIGLSFLSGQGKFMGRMSGPVKGSVHLRRAQYRWADDCEKSLHLARLFVAGKISNSRTVLMRAVRDHRDESYCKNLGNSAEYLKRNQKLALNAGSIEFLRGIEGDAANTYFESFDHLIVSQKESFFMRGRNRRPPRDNLNVLLSFTYSLLAHEVISALETVGLDPQVGFLHVDRPGRPSLALDLMEEFRAYFADRLVLSLINRLQVDKKGFSGSSDTGITMDENTRKTVIAAWQQRKQEEIMHPFLKEKISIGLIPYSQAMLLARFIRGDIDDYPVFLMK